MDKFYPIIFMTLDYLVIKIKIYGRYKNITYLFFI